MRSEQISDKAFFQHRYITRPVVTPKDQIVKAVGDLTSALQQGINVRGAEEMEVLQMMNNILNRKKVTFQDPIPEQRVGRSAGNMQQSPKTILSPRVATATIKPLATIPINKVAGKPPATAATKGLIVAKPFATVPNNGPTTWSKYAQALADIDCRRQAAPSPQLSMMELAQSVLDDNPLSTTEQAFEVFDDDTGKLLKYWQLITHPKYHEVWMHSSANEFGRLVQGDCSQIQGTNTILFIHKHQVPADRWRDITYAKFVCELKSNKKEVHQTKLTVGGNKVHYLGDVGTPTADLTLLKMHINSIISTRGAWYKTIDVENFYLNMPMVRYEYVHIKLYDIPEEIIAEYKLRKKVTEDGYVHVEIQKGMYKLPQAGILVQELLEKWLNEHGYSQSKTVPGLWTHKTRPILFTLVVDDFGVKYIGKEHAMHLISILKQH